MMSEEKNRRGGLPALYNVTPEQLKVVAGAVLTSGVADIAFHNPAILIGSLLFTGGAAWMSPEIVEMIVPGANRDAVANATHQTITALSPEPEIDPYKDQSTLAKLKRLAGMKTPPVLPESKPKDDTFATGTDESEEEDTVFVQQQSSRDISGVDRITIEQIVKNTTPNSYKVWIGRSLTQPGNPAISINFRKRHIKLIGASQKGKSSEAAALLESILKTHDKEHVLVALLDMEDQTSRLFADVPHLAELVVDNKVVLLHARSREQVLEHLEYIVGLMDYRYTLDRSELVNEPILLVYLEEFIALKDYFKQRVDSVIGKEEKEQAKKDYARLVYCIKEIARRGLKVLVQFLMCAQVDYRDEDLQEALINVTSGMSFAVRVSAAQAAGFYQSELLNRNAKEGYVGQAVCEMPDCKDLILSPEYDLEARLIALEEQEKRAKSIYKKQSLVNVKTPIYQSVNGPVNGSTSVPVASEQGQHLHLLVNDSSELETPVEPPVNVNVNADIRKTIKRLVEMGGMPHNKIAKAVGLDGRYYPTYKQVCKEMGIATEKEGA